MGAVIEFPKARKPPADARSVRLPYETEAELNLLQEIRNAVSNLYGWMTEVDKLRKRLYDIAPSESEHHEN